VAKMYKAVFKYRGVCVETPSFDKMFLDFHYWNLDLNMNNTR